MNACGRRSPSCRIPIGRAFDPRRTFHAQSPGWRIAKRYPREVAPFAGAARRTPAAGTRLPAPTDRSWHAALSGRERCSRSYWRREQTCTARSVSGRFRSRSWGKATTSPAVRISGAALWAASHLCALAANDLSGTGDDAQGHPLLRAAPLPQERASLPLIVRERTVGRRRRGAGQAPAPGAAACWPMSP